MAKRVEIWKIFQVAKGYSAWKFVVVDGQTVPAFEEKEATAIESLRQEFTVMGFDCCPRKADEAQEVMEVWVGITDVKM